MLVGDRDDKHISSKNIRSGNEEVSSHWILGIFEDGNERIMDEFNMRGVGRVGIIPSLKPRCSMKGNEI